MQGVGHYSPLRAGLAFLPIGLSTFAGSLAGTRLVRHIGIRPTILFGAAVGAAGLFWLAAVLDPHVAYVSHLLGPLILFGFGCGSALVPMTLAATQDVPPARAGLASGLINTSRQIGGAVGLAVMSMVIAEPHRSPAAGFRGAFLVGGLVLLGGLLCGAAITSAKRPPKTSPPQLRTASADELAR